MKNNQYFWNQTLRFSWGHIVAFIALIFINYVMYMGDFYQNGGNFASAAIKIGIIDVFLLTTFIGAQIIKGTDEKFNRSIVIERILICLCPLVFIIAMSPYNHFWIVFEQREQIEAEFNSSIEGAKQMFVAYDKYVEDRIKTYENNLDSILIAKANGNETIYVLSGFIGKDDHLRKNNYVHTLTLQLRSQNTDSLKFVATKWINEANQGASVWNAFLVGNVEQIDKAINSWNRTLQEYSHITMSNETVRGNKVLPFDEDRAFIIAATKGINSLKSIYREKSGINIHTIWTSFIIFFMLLFPYFLQKRNTRAEGLYFLIPGSKAKSYKKNVVKPSNSMHQKENSDNDDIYIHNEKSCQDEDLFGGTF